MTRQLNTPAVQAEVAADYNGLPHARITDHAGEAHIITATLQDLEQWLLTLGGTLHRQTADDHAAVWTLHTTIPDHGPQVVVHALTLDTDPIDPAYAHFVIDEPAPNTPCPHAA
ncbi:MAG TPA: hypothetical protein VGL02_12650 [Streptomyces sp.]